MLTPFLYIKKKSPFVPSPSQPHDLEALLLGTNHLRGCSPLILSGFVLLYYFILLLIFVLYDIASVLNAYAVHRLG